MSSAVPLGRSRDRCRWCRVVPLPQTPEPGTNTTTSIQKHTQKLLKCTSCNVMYIFDTVIQSNRWLLWKVATRSATDVLNCSSVSDSSQNKFCKVMLKLLLKLFHSPMAPLVWLLWWHLQLGGRLKPLCLAWEGCWRDRFSSQGDGWGRVSIACFSPPYRVSSSSKVGCQPSCRFFPFLMAQLMWSQ